MAEKQPLVSIITPTGKREALLRLQYANVLNQSISDWEWLILDDSPAPSRFFSELEDRRVRYEHHAGPRQTIGAKRNRLVENAKADIIAHFDDDDYYAPRYLETMQGHIGQDTDVTKLSAFYVYSVMPDFFGYWDTMLPGEICYFLDKGDVQLRTIDKSATAAIAQFMQVNYQGYGFSYAYKRAVWVAAPFPDKDRSEDTGFIQAALQAGFKLQAFPDTPGLCLHILRTDNASGCFPQFHLPNYLLTEIFSRAVKEMIGW